MVFKLYGLNLAKDRYRIFNSEIDEKLIIIKDIFSGFKSP